MEMMISYDLCLLCVCVLHPIWTPRCLWLEPLTPFGNVYVSYFCVVPLRPGSSAGRTASVLSRRRIYEYFWAVNGRRDETLLRCVPATLTVSGTRPRLPRRAQRRRLSSVKAEQPAETFGGSSSSLRLWRLLALSRRRPLIKDGPMWR